MINFSQNIDQKKFQQESQNMDEINYCKKHNQLPLHDTPAFTVSGESGNGRLIW